MNTVLNTPQMTTSKNMALAVAQILLWGGSFFILSVLANPIKLETGWSQQGVYSALSLSLLVCGLVSAKVGRIINQSSRGSVLMFSGMVMAAGLIIMGFAHQFWIFIVAWLIIGIAMAMGLYDALFAFLGKKQGQGANKSIVQITLISGFAPTITWFLLSYALDYFDWRTLCFIYAMVLIIFIFPLHRYAFRIGEDNAVHGVDNSVNCVTSVAVYDTKLFRLILVYFTLGAFLMTGITVHLIDILLVGQMDLRTAVSIAALLGPSQVGVRILDFVLPRSTPVKKALISAIAIFLGLFLLLVYSESAVVGVVVFGLGNGLRSILKGTLPLFVFGQKYYAVLMGKLAGLPMLIQAATPFLGGFILHRYSVSIFVSLLVVVALLNVFLVLTIQKSLRYRSNTSG